MNRRWHLLTSIDHYRFDKNYIGVVYSDNGNFSGRVIQLPLSVGNGKTLYEISNCNSQEIAYEYLKKYYNVNVARIE
jgi:hypothetical protein